MAASWSSRSESHSDVSKLAADGGRCGCDPRGERRRRSSGVQSASGCSEKRAECMHAAAAHEERRAGTSQRRFECAFATGREGAGCARACSRSAAWKRAHLPALVRSRRRPRALGSILQSWSHRHLHDVTEARDSVAGLIHLRVECLAHSPLPSLRPTGTGKAPGADLCLKPVAALPAEFPQRVAIVHGGAAGRRHAAQHAKRCEGCRGGGRGIVVLGACLGR